MTSFVLSIYLSVSILFPFGSQPTPGDPFLIVNKMTNELAFINENEVQRVLPVATGRSTEDTPEGLFTIIIKAEDPYYRKKNIKGGAKDNPLGTRWIGFDAKGTNGRIYGVHGTNRPDSIGKYITAGCIRLLNKEVESLFEVVPIGTKIMITTSENDFYKLGVEAGALSKDKAILDHKGVQINFVH
ncbi:L,D-transpeptidase [Alkalihalobacillus hwajinpoensis]|uniref:L,D-transpeptidase n=1 Tax=Guptibacillus hwajinpoensis TaxID=208199 RepID=UPI001883ED4A|nr:L,D-transpeptidase [Pseudalkalibacillus hwajinpoensis]MBF0709185.1 L,D-transpeptidase [Pseudalkalibacillus hwajinpoensis]